MPLLHRTRLFLNSTRCTHRSETRCDAFKRFIKKEKRHLLVNCANDGLNWLKQCSVFIFVSSTLWFFFLLHFWFLQLLEVSLFSSEIIGSMQRARVQAFFTALRKNDSNNTLHLLQAS